MSFSNYGYAPESYDEVFARIVNNILANIPDMSLDPSSLVFQWAKILATEVVSLQDLIERFTSNMTVVGADEFYTMLHGAEVGVFRKLATRASGFVKVKADIGTTIPVAMRFTATNGVSFESTETTVYNSYITMRRGRNESDGIPFAYPDFVPSALYYSQTLESGMLIESGWWYSSGAIYWDTHNPAVSGWIPDYGSYYYAVPSGGSYYINVPIQCVSGGTVGNVGAGTITSYDPTVVDGVIREVTNDNPITNGTDVEPLDEYKRRILSAKRVPTSLGYIRSLAEQVQGVKYAKVFEVLNDDVTIPSDWNDMSTYTSYVALDNSGSYYSFSFTPSDGVATLQGISLWANVTGTPGDLLVYLTPDTGTVRTEDDAVASVSLDVGVLNKNGFTTPQKIFVPLKKNGITKTEAYRVFFKPYNCDASNHWNLYVDTSVIGSSYIDNTVYSGGEFIRKTHYLSPAFNIVVHPYSDSEFENVSSRIESAIEDYVPVGVQYEIVEARKVYLSLMVDVVKEEDSDFTTIENDIVTAVQNYLSSLEPGDDVIYSQIEKAILQVDGVYKEKNLEIWINDTPHSTPNNEMDQFVDYDEVVELDTNGYYGGVTIREVPT